MRNEFAKRAITVAGAALLSIPFLGVGIASAHGSGGTTYVAPNASPSASGRSCHSAIYSDINAAIAAAPAGSTVAVCRGTYATDAVVNKDITLTATSSHVLIDATGQPEVIPGAGGNGVTILAAGATVEGLSVANASGDGILIGGVDHVKVKNTNSSHNGGFGIDINSSSWAKVTGNTVKDNTAGGVNIANDLNIPASHNLVQNNVAVGNTNGCGIVLADHTGAGIFENKILDNVTNGNGLTVEGAGIVLASPVPGGAVYNNLVEGNSAHGNGLAGVTLHSHEPGQNLNGNVIVHNDLGRNNLLGDDPGIDSPADVADMQTTGILVASAGPLSITVAHNQISDDHFGIWTVGPVTVDGVHTNSFHHVAVHFFAAS